MASTTFDNSLSVLQRLEQTRRDFWSSHANLSEEERQDLWIQATSVSPNNAFGTSHASTAQQTPRSLPASSMTYLPTMDLGLPDRALAAPQMRRSSSSTTADSSLSQRPMSAMSAWQSISQEPANDYTFYSDVAMRQQQYLQSIPEAATYSNHDMTEWSPCEYISNYVEPASSSSLPFSLPLHTQQLPVQLTPNWSSSSDSSLPSTPSTALTTPIIQSSNSMSRQSSCGSHFLGDASMLRIQSDSSCMLPILTEDEVPFFPSYVEPKTISHCVDGSLFPTSFLDSSNEETFFSPVQSASVSAQAHVSFEHEMPYLAEDMRRSASATSSEGKASDASSSSACSRQTRREREIIALAAARKIAPKAIDNDEAESAPSNAQMARIRSEDGSSKTFGVISKTPYVRPQHPKIMCQFCQERPEGFRGTHELDRHIARAHAPSRKGYICVDFSSDKKFLANCKHCRNKKVYGAYYNAAAHLRRAHFHPRKRGRKGKNDEKRGGIGGGDDPPMDYLKMHWIKELEVDNKPNASSPDSASDDATEATDNSYESTFDVDTYSSQQPISSSTNAQAQTGPGQYDYGLDVNASETMMYDTNTFAAYDSNITAPNNLSSFQFDAYM